MITLTLIGIGTGNPDHLTLQAAKAMNAADLILIPLKGADKADLAGLRRQICAGTITNPATRILEFPLPVRDVDNPSYRAGVDDWHDAIAREWEAQIARHLANGGGPNIALLVWGDPALYDSSLRIAARVSLLRALQVKVIPGITAIHALCAAHAIPLNQIGAPFTVTTGRALRDHGWPQGVDTCVVLLDGTCAFQTLDPSGLSIWWGAFVGMQEQILAAGDLAQTGPHIIDLRARARAAHGWIMDIYLMRRH
jgi:precorrin-6A synthase